MRKSFAILENIDGTIVQWGTLFYDIKYNKYQIQIEHQNVTNYIRMPYIFKHFYDLGEFTLSEEWSLKWVRMRVIPPERQNIDDYLQELNMTEYNEFELLVDNLGRCCMDSCYLCPSCI